MKPKKQELFFFERRKIKKKKTSVKSFKQFFILDMTSRNKEETPRRRKRKKGELNGRRKTNGVNANPFLLKGDKTKSCQKTNISLDLGQFKLGKIRRETAPLP
jgi:hypothetical protein